MPPEEYVLVAFRAMLVEVFVHVASPHDQFQEVGDCVLVSLPCNPIGCTPAVTFLVKDATGEHPPVAVILTKVALTFGVVALSKVLDENVYATPAVNPVQRSYVVVLVVFFNRVPSFQIIVPL